MTTQPDEEYERLKTENLTKIRRLVEQKVMLPDLGIRYLRFLLEYMLGEQLAAFQLAYEQDLSKWLDDFQVKVTLTQFPKSGNDLIPPDQLNRRQRRHG